MAKKPLTSSGTGGIIEISWLYNGRGARKVRLAAERSGTPPSLEFFRLTKAEVLTQTTAIPLEVAELETERLPLSDLSHHINTIIQGDCLDVMRQMPDECVDMILCDLPYGTTQCSWDTIIPFEPLWEQYKRIIKPNGAIVLTASQPFTSALVMSNIAIFKYSWVWNKLSPSGHLNAKKQPMRKTEDICVFGTGQGTYNPQGLMWNPRVKSRNPTDVYGSHGNINVAIWQGYPTNYLEIKNEFGLHPTQKPVELFAYLIRTYTNEGEVVLDNCIGSGTTAVAAIKTDRHFIGIDIDEEYCRIARERIRIEQSQLRLF